jgi:hypothetical protein
MTDDDKKKLRTEHRALFDAREKSQERIEKMRHEIHDVEAVLGAVEARMGVIQEKFGGSEIVEFAFDAAATLRALDGTELFTRRQMMVNHHCKFGVRYTVGERRADMDVPDGCDAEQFAFMERVRLRAAAKAAGHELGEQFDVAWVPILAVGDVPAGKGDPSSSVHLTKMGGDDGDDR